MKKRSFIPIASLVVLSGAAAVSGTFAWFQTNRSLSLSFNDATIRSRDSSLVVEFVDSLNTLKEEPVASSLQGDIKLNMAPSQDVDHDSQFITDVSGNGVDFYKLDQGYRPNDNTDKLDGVSWQIPLKIDTVELDAVGDADGKIIDFTLKLSRTQLTENFSDDLEVYIGSGTKIEPVTAAGGDAAQRAKDLKAVAGARLAISEVGVGNVLTPKMLMTQVAEPNTFNMILGYDENNDPIYELDGDDAIVPFDNTPNYTYVVEEAGKEAYQIDGFRVVDATDKDEGGHFDEVVVLDTLLPSTDLVESNQNHDTFVVELGENEIQLNFRMWLEGTDSDVGYDDNNTAVGGKIKLTLDLYTLHAGRN